jgi:hypothetical protein
MNKKSPKEAFKTPKAIKIVLKIHPSIRKFLVLNRSVWGKHT